MIVAVLASNAPAVAQTTHPASRPNILWIGVDQMRHDTPSCAGNPVCRTPAIDRLAREGIRFTRAYTPCCLCSPARASMLTGRFAFHHGMGTNCDLYHALASELPDPKMLLHYRLMERGYRCGFVGKWHVGARIGPAEYGFEGMSIPGYGDVKTYPGYEAYLRKAGLSYGPVKNPIYGNPGGKTLLAGRWNGPEASTPACYLAEYAIQMLDGFAASGRPFLLVCQFWGPHSPHLPSPEFAGRSNRALIQPWVNFLDDYRDKPAALRRFRRDFYRSLPADWSGWREIVGLYYDYTAMIDRQIGRLLDRLHELRIDRETIVVFESDHGDMLGSHGGLFDKGFMYEENYRVPMIVRWPGHVAADRTSDELVYNMDILPTILDIVGHPDETLDGISLRPILEGRDLPRRREAIYLEFHGIRSLSSQRAVVTGGGDKYIFNAQDDDEFYDLRRDPGELTNRIASTEYTAGVERARRLLQEAAARARDPIADYIAKLFGDWENLSGQFEAAAPVTGRP
jgi:arylsulfatase A-like enzyme